MKSKEMTDAVQQLVAAVAPEIWVILLQSLATVAVCLALYKVLNQIVAYYFVRFDKELGKNVGIVIEGRTGYIAHITIRHIIIKFDEGEGRGIDVHAGNDVLIPITQVASRVWEIIRRKD